MENRGLQGLEKNASFGMLASRIGNAVSKGANSAVTATGNKLSTYGSAGGMKALKSDIGKGVTAVGDKMTSIGNNGIGATVKNQYTKATNKFTSLKDTFKAPKPPVAK